MSFIDRPSLSIMASSSATTTTTTPLQPTPEIIRKFNELTQEVNQLASKIAELEFDRNEHKLVEDTLKPLDGQRRAYRLVGEVLVERTVEEVLPSVSNNREQVWVCSLLSWNELQFLLWNSLVRFISNALFLVILFPADDSYFAQLETTITQLQAHLDAKNKEATELKTKYNLQTEPAR